MSQQVDDFALFNWHFLLVCIFHCLFIVHPSILKGKVLLFTHFRQSSFEIIIAITIDKHLSVSYIIVQLFSGLALDQVDQNVDLLIIEIDNHGHELLKPLLIFFMFFNFGLLKQIHNFNHVFEVLRLGNVFLGKEYLRNMVLVIEFSDLFFGVELNIIILIPVDSK